MSYVRFGWDGSDVYVYEGSEGFECCGCRLTRDQFNCELPEEMILHLAKHRRAGQFVPEYAITGLWDDIEGADKASEPENEVFTHAKQVMWIGEYFGWYGLKPEEIPFKAILEENPAPDRVA